MKLASWLYSTMWIVLTFAHFLGAVQAVRGFRRGAW